MCWLVWQDVQWNDIEYMDRYLDFTLDAKFSALPDMIKDLHAHDQRYVIIVVPGTFVFFRCIVWLTALVWRPFPHAGSRHQQHPARGLVLDVRGRTEERCVCQRLWRKCHYREGEDLPTISPAAENGVALHPKLSLYAGVARTDGVSGFLQWGNARMVVRQPEEVPREGAVWWLMDCEY